MAEAGYNLVTVVIALTLLNVALAVALPVWSHVMQREKEEELIFRGVQYAEAIRIFQRRYGRPPVRLEELVEVKPRSIRQLWPDPMTDDGKWGLIFQQTVAGPGILGQQGGNTSRLPVRPRGRGNQQPTTGPIHGVHSTSSDESIKIFMGENRYDQWRFVVNMATVPLQPRPDAPLPRASPQWFLRPFRDGLQPQMPGASPGADPTGDNNRGGQGGPGTRGGNPRVDPRGIPPLPEGNPSQGRPGVPPSQPGQNRGGGN